MPRRKMDVRPALANTLAAVQALPPGEWISAPEIEKNTGTSSSAVNIALKELLDGGLVERRLEYFGNRFNGEGLVNRGRLKKYYYRMRQAPPVATDNTATEKAVEVKNA